MAPLSTGQVARAVGIHRVTLEKWLRQGKVKQPRAFRIGARTYRLWSEKDVARIHVYKEKSYRKGRGRKKAQSKK